MPSPTVRAVTLEELKRELTGARPRSLVVNHWATWCDPCHVELPHLLGLHKKFGKRCDFLGVSWDLFVAREDVEVAKARLLSFVLGHGLHFDQLLYTGTPEALWKGLALPSRTIPITVIVGVSGQSVSVFDGPLLLPKDITRFEHELEATLD
jgi:thiol-disulfide isomerase/thioredoxin